MSESDCNESEENADVIDNVPVNPDIYVARDGTEWISHNLADLRLEIVCDKAVVQQASRNIMSTSFFHHIKATRGLLATDHVILNHSQVSWTTPELAPPLLTTTPHQREDVSALDRFNVHRCPTRRVFSGTGLKPVTKQATVRYLYHSATAATTTMLVHVKDIALYQRSKSGKQLPKVWKPRKDFWRRPWPIQGSQAIEEKVIILSI
ncbi:uncharacterized protein TNCV_2355141 [Trichonephila clavipes]|nr:uncharacterized protein TNCV_2355141 [Trichonephila clavipes]